MTISYALEREQRTKVSVYDVQGRLVRVLESGVFAAGRQEWPEMDQMADLAGRKQTGVYRMIARCLSRG